MIAIGADHGGYELKNKIINNFKNIEFKDFGTNSSESVDYPEIALKVCQSIINGECNEGILICKTGIGVSIAANKVKGIRCALCYSKKVAKLAKEHNDANVLAIGADCLTEEEVYEIIEEWEKSTFEGGRHQKRVDLIKEIESK